MKRTLQADVQNKYYTEINQELITYEQGKPWHTKTMEWICNRIDWAWKWRKITEQQMEELADRVCIYLNTK